MKIFKIKIQEMFSKKIQKHKKIEFLNLNADKKEIIKTKKIHFFQMMQVLCVKKIFKQE